MCNYIYNGAAKGGQMDIILWFKSLGLFFLNCECHKDNNELHTHHELTYYAAMGGQKDFLLQLLNNKLSLVDNNEFFKYDACKGAALGGHLDLLKWLRQEGFPWDHSTCYAAAESGNLELFNWVVENKCMWHKYTSNAAALGGNIEIFKYAYKRKINDPYYEDDYDLSYNGLIKNGDCNLEMTIWLHENGYLFDGLSELSTCTAAANGDLELLKWILIHGGKLKGNECEFAVHKGQLETLKWLITQKCVWTSTFLIRWSSTKGPFLRLRGIWTSS